MYRKIFLTGGTGFVGTEILKELVKNKYKVKVLTHERKPEVLSNLVEIVNGDVKDTDSFIDSVKGCDTIIHLVGIIRETPWRDITFERLHVEATKNMITAAKQNKIKRFIHMSANGAKPKGTKYQTTKWRAEQLVKNSGLIYTIFRPSIIFGEHDNFTNRLARQMRFGIVPYIGDGNYQLQPVSVKTVAEAFVKSINNKKAFNKIYHLGGPEIYRYKELLDLIASKTGRKIVKFSVPVWIVRIFASLFGWLPQFPITNEQLTMLLEGNVCDYDKVKKDLKLSNPKLDSLKIKFYCIHQRGCK
ncbi:MAG: complex I NDUFA9 subunit family protein [Candidatus Aenigmatarchaeota archaeon]|nr:complex I NDUFA9 subunit family protein [Candidatus Aenigmarchaeota archaeon]